MRLREHEGILPGRAEINYCKPEAITLEDGYNVRDLTTPEARAELDELKSQIKENGVLTPLKIRFDAANARIILVEGHRRRTVCLELIDEYVKSGGAEGRLIEAVPIFPETPGTDPADRDFGLETSNSGTRLRPLELANLIHRLLTVRGISLEVIAKRMGKSLASIKGTLALRAMPEEVKQQVRDGTVSASLAQKFLKEEPEKAAEMFRQNQQENKRLGVGAKMNNRVTPKTLKRDKQAKAKPPENDRREGAICSEDQTVGARSEINPVNAPTTIPTPPMTQGAEPAAAQDGLPAQPVPPIAPSGPVAHVDLLPILIELHRHAKHILEANRSDECPGGFWTREFADAIRVAERAIGMAGGKPDPFARLDAAVDETRALAEADHG